MYYIYGATKSAATDKAENLLIACKMQYKIFVLGKDYTVEQLQRLVPKTETLPHIYDGTKYIGGLKDLYDYLYILTKFDDGE
jgi:ferredoxin-fold anticodon binding domain-containing protein